MFSKDILLKSLQPFLTVKDDSFNFIEFIRSVTFDNLGESDQIPDSIVQVKRKAHLVDAGTSSLFKGFVFRDATILELGSIYPSVIATDNQFKFNYSNFSKFLEFVYEVRSELKEELKLQHDSATAKMCKLLKIYANSIFGLMNKELEGALPYTPMERTHVLWAIDQTFALISSKAIELGMQIIGFHGPDTIIFYKSSQEQQDTLKEYFETSEDFETLLNRKIAKINFRIEDVAYFTERKYISASSLTVRGLTVFSEKKKETLFPKANKMLKEKFKHFPEIFPEYQI